MTAPLIDLYKNPSGSPNNYTLAYPEGIPTTRINHHVLFSIFETAVNVVEDPLINNLNPAGDFVGSLNEEGITNLRDDVAKQAGINQQNLNQSSTNQKNLNQSTRFSVKTKTTSQPVGSIALYIPEDVTFTQEAQYGEVSLNDALSSLTGGAIGAVTSYIDKGGNAALRLGLNYLGYVFNPQQQVMFEGIDFRQFEMSFTFSPKSAKEAIIVRNIIQTFRQHAAPRIVTSVGGFFFTPPSQFNISYRLGNKENEFVNKIKPSVLENVTVSYAPNGWAAHSDGSPVQTTLTLTFKEIELVDKIDIQNGY
jgi:hypothetical protein